MSIQGAMAASLRRFDPYPEFDNVRVFRGRPATGGRQFYKTGGLIVPRFEMVSGVQIVGGAGFGQREINGALRPARADEPLIGDGGLRNAEARTNSSPLRSPFQIYPAGLLIPDARSVVNGFPSPDGMNAASRLSDLSTTSVETLTVASSAAVVPGQLYTAVFGVMKADGPTDAAGDIRPSLIRVNRASSITQRLFNAFTGSGEVGLTVMDMGSWWRLSMPFTPAAGETWAGLAIFPAHNPNNANTGYIDVWFGGVLAGPDINDPPILQEGGLPATRTGYGNFETGRRIAPLHYGVARARWLAPLANHEAAFPHLLELRDGGGIGRTLWYASKAGGATRITAGNNGGGADPVIALSAPVIGEWSTIAWAVRGAELAVSEMGGAVQVAAMSAPPPLMTRMGHLGSATTPGNNTANAEMDCCLTANGEISNAALQALSARFAA